MIYKCPHCGSNIVDNSNITSKEIVIKSRLVFLNNDGNVLGRCLKCKNVVALPLSFTKSSDILQVKEIIDI